MAEFEPRSDGLGSVLQSILNFGTRGRAPSVTDSDDEESAPKSISNVVAVVEGIRSLENMIGIASLNLNTLEIQLIQFRDPYNYDLTKECIKSLDPDVVIYPGYEKKNLINANPKFTNESTISVEPYDCQFFNERNGNTYLCTYGKNFMPRDLGFSQVLPVVAASACFSYVLYVLNVREFQDKCIDVTIPSRRGHMNMDLTTIKTLELLASADTGDHKRSLFSLFNRTYTKRGMRILKANIVQPLAIKEEIIKRHEVVDELVRRRNLFDDLNAQLSPFNSVNMDFALKAIVVRNKSPNANTANTYIESLVDAAVYLREILTHTKPLMDVLKDVNASLFQSIHSQLAHDESIYGEILQRIRLFISDTCTVTKGHINYKTTKLFAIEPSVDKYLEIKRKTYSEILENMTSLAAYYEKEYNRPIRLNYQTNRGYHFLIPMSDTEQQDGSALLPNVFTCATRKGKNFLATSKSLINAENNLRRVEKDIYKMAGEAVIKLIDDLTPIIGVISCLFENIGTIDFIRTLALIAVENNFVRPVISNYFEGRNVVNPLLLLKEDRKDIQSQVVANPIPRLSSNDISTLLLTGPNQSGKSCYLSTVALLQIMAQIGSFVPVETENIPMNDDNSSTHSSVRASGSLVIPIVDQIFTRMGLDDDYISSSSSFLREVVQIDYILKRATAKSLVIIDELGRGTSIEEGVSFCFAVLEKLLKTKCITFIASHFHDLIKLECMYPNIICYEMEHRREQEAGRIKLLFTYKAKVIGDHHFTEYGIDTAECMELPMDIIARARNIAAQIQTLSPDVTQEQQKRREIYRLYVALMRIAETDWSSDRSKIMEWFVGAKKQFIDHLTSLRSPLEINSNK